MTTTPVTSDASVLANHAGIVDRSRFRHCVQLGQPGVGNVVPQQRVRPGTDREVTEWRIGVLIPAVLSTQPLYLSPDNLHAWLRVIIKVSQTEPTDKTHPRWPFCRRAHMPRSPTLWSRPPVSPGQEVKQTNQEVDKGNAHQAVVKLVPQLRYRIEVVTSIVAPSRGPMVTDLKKSGWEEATFFCKICPLAEYSFITILI